MIATVALWTASATLGWVYIGYPVIVAVLARVAPRRPRRDGPRPSLTVAIAVHDEADQIAERVADALMQAGPELDLVEVLVGSDGSTDDTDPIVARLARDDDRVRLLSLPRAGQTATQHAMFEVARGDVVVLTDAETRFAPDCLAALADAFRDSRVGAATGRLDWRAEDATATSSNEGLYWRYERLIRELESRADCLTAVTGALLAVRRSRYRPVPPTASMDHLLPLYVRECGDTVTYVPAAVATDRPISGLREQLRNRTRTASRGIRANLTMVGRLAPWSHPRIALALWSHKILRWSTPWLLLVVAASGLLEATKGDRVGALATIVVGGGLVAAAGGQVIASVGHRPPRPLAFARAFAIVNLAFAHGWLEVLRGRRIETWQRVEVQRNQDLSMTRRKPRP